MSTSIPTPRMQPSPFVEQFKVLVRDKLFTLSRTQIEFDSPNYFTAAFLGEYSEAASKTIHVDCHPTIFSLIKDYLSGDDILPLRKEIIPATMTLDRAREKLIASAQFLGLDKLESLLHPVLVEDITEAMINHPLGQLLLLDHCKDSRENIKFLLLRNTGLTVQARAPGCSTFLSLNMRFQLAEEHRVLLSTMLPPTTLITNCLIADELRNNWLKMKTVHIESWSGNLQQVYEFCSCAAHRHQTEGLRREFGSFVSNERLPLIVEEALILIGKDGIVLGLGYLKAKKCETAMEDFMAARSNSRR